MGVLLNRDLLSDRMNNPAILDPDKYPSEYLTGLISDVSDEIAWYLGFDPRLLLHENEEGPAWLVESGMYAGRYMVEIKNYPLPANPISAWISQFKLTYAMSLTTPTNVSLDLVTVQHQTGQLFCLAPGTPDALAGVMFGRAPVMGGIQATSYRISYTSGYSTGISDPVDSNSNPFAVPPLPEDIRQAAVMLCRERIAFDAAGNASPTQPAAGLLYRLRVGEREESYRAPVRPPGSPQIVLGYGGPLASAAQMKLSKHAKRRGVVFV